MIKINHIYQGDALEILKTFPDESMNCCITSPPYWRLRNYNVEGQIGLEETPEQYISKLIEIFREVKRVLRNDGTLWANLGDSYAGGGGASGIPEDWYSISTNNIDKYPTTEDPKRNAKKIDLKPKDLVGIPWMVAFALRADGWYLRSDIIWAKGACMPEPVTDRPTRSHEYIFLLSKNKKYYYDADAIKEIATTNENRPHSIVRDRVYDYDSKQKQLGRGYDRQYEETTPTGFRNKRDVWHINPHPFPEAHFAIFPEKLIEPMVKAGCPKKGIVLDPFMGSGTTALVSRKLYRNWIGIELNPKYIEIANKRIGDAMEQKGIYEFDLWRDDKCDANTKD